MIFFTFILTLLYALLVMVFLLYWEKIPVYSGPSDSDQSTRISVIVAARNEEKNIENLLEDLNRQDYPAGNFEVIVINDFSTDMTAALVNRFIQKARYRLVLLNLPEEYKVAANKKRAIQTGIGHSSGDLIVTTDGDCRVKEKWLSSFEYFYSLYRCKMVAGPVTFSSGNIFQQMQTIEFASLIGSGAATLQMGLPTMCNGANLAYEKKAFYEVNGFEGNESVPSGDDEFLMHKMHRTYPGKVMFIKSPDSVVLTEAKENLADFVQQRKRWSGKWKYYEADRIRGLAFFIFIYHLAMILTLAMVTAGHYSGALFLEQILIKGLIEFVFLKRVLAFFNRKIQIIPFILLEIIYPLYVVFFAFASLSGKYTWKARRLTN